MPAMVQGYKGGGLHLPQWGSGSCTTINTIQGCSPDFPTCAPDAVLINYYKELLSVHKSILTAPSPRITSVLRLCTGARDAEAGCCNGYEEKRHRTGIQGGRQDLFALLSPHICTWDQNMAPKCRISTQSHWHVTKNILPFFSSVTVIAYFCFLRWEMRL